MACTARRVRAAPTASKKGTRVMRRTMVEKAEAMLIFSTCFVCPMAVNVVLRSEWRARRITEIDSRVRALEPEAYSGP